jgi:hypothetical protein
MKTRVTSRGKKTDDLLQFIHEAGLEGRRYTDIIRFVYEYSYGKGTYTNNNRGYWSGAFKTPTRDAGGYGHLVKYLTKNEKGNWILRNKKV